MNQLRYRRASTGMWTGLLCCLIAPHGPRPSVRRGVALASINFSKLLRYGEIMEDAIPARSKCILTHLLCTGIEAIFQAD